MLALAFTLAAQVEQFRAVRVLPEELTAEAAEVLGRTGFNAVLLPMPPGPTDHAFGRALFEAHRNGLEVHVRLEGQPDEILAGLELLCFDHDLDGLHLADTPFDEAWLARLRERLRTIDPALLLSSTIERPKGSVDLVVPIVPAEKALETRLADAAGEIHAALAPLLADRADLALALRDGPYEKDASVPMRAGKNRRPPGVEAEPTAGAGRWMWKMGEGAPAFLELEGGEEGRLSWGIAAPEKGLYSLHVWIPPGAAHGTRAAFEYASVGGRRKITIDPSRAQNQGWVRVGSAHLPAETEIEAVRLLALEQDATRVTAAGPLLALRDRRPSRK